jgi:hypothetical protein
MHAARRPPDVSRRGIGPDLLLVAAGWAGFVVLVVMALARAT